MSTNIKWNVETTIKFIQLHKLNPCLWNFKSPEYKIKQKRDAAYNSIVNGMNITGFENKKIQESKKSGARIE
ncbi:hypothetical protein ABMA27_003177 [Loxostege sticticalis]|uniref:MADF domain-containing protein n=1 Tax=Loxostege sticticalis TaxID=481309 RepID=A0ABR3HS97_LOXSC